MKNEAKCIGNNDAALHEYVDLKAYKEEDWSSSRGNLARSMSYRDLLVYIRCKKRAVWIRVNIFTHK